MIHWCSTFVIELTAKLAVLFIESFLETSYDLDVKCRLLLGKRSSLLLHYYYCYCVLHHGTDLWYVRKSSVQFLNEIEFMSHHFF